MTTDSSMQFLMQLLKGQGQPRKGIIPARRGAMRFGQMPSGRIKNYGLYAPKGMNFSKMMAMPKFGANSQIDIGDNLKANSNFFKVKKWRLF